MSRPVIGYMVGGQNKVAEQAGESVRLLRRFGRRYAAALRLVTLVPLGTVAVLRPAPEHLAATVVVVATVVLWTCGYCWWLNRTTRSLPVAVDVLVLLGACLSVFVTDAVEDTNTGWLRLLVAFAGISWQWHTPPWAGGLAALAVGGGLLTFVTMAGPGVSVPRSLVWVPVTAVLSRAGWLIVERAARLADRAAAEAELARRESLVAAAARAEERELANALHDTAATTLLMVGSGQVRADAPWLAPQARRDLERLRSDGEQSPSHADLVDLLRADAEASYLAVTVQAPPSLHLPFGVARAIADAAREALNNVRRHAGTDRATVRLDGDVTGLRLDIADDGGGGFSPGDVPATRRGLRESVHGRMERIGGTADVTSAPGAGTVVRLEWRGGRD